MVSSTSLFSSEQPLVSILCPTYNHEKFIADALDSFLMQKTNFPVEILINEDCSTDGTAAIVKKYEKQFPEIIKVIYQHENLYSKGKKPLTQMLFPKSKGKYIATCEGDDFWVDENKLQKQVDFLENNPEYSMCYTDFSHSNEKGEITKQSAIWKYKCDLTHLKILEFYTPRTLTVMFRAHLIHDLFEREIPVVPNGDTFLFAYIAKKGLAGYLDFVSGCQRFNNKSIFSSRPFDVRNKMLIKTLNTLKSYFTDKDEQKAINANLSRKYIFEAIRCFKKMKLAKAIIAIFRSLKLSRKPYYDRITNLIHYPGYAQMH